MERRVTRVQLIYWLTIAGIAVIGSLTSQLVMLALFVSTTAAVVAYLIFWPYLRRRHEPARGFEIIVKRRSNN
jgi:hypothetical protein